MNRMLVLFTALGLMANASVGADAGARDEEPGGWAAVIQHYGDLGEHRSGTAVDAQTGLWLQSELQARGMAASLQTWPLRVFQLSGCRLQTAVRAYETYPFWYPLSTGPEGLEGPLVNADEALANDLTGAVALLRLPPGRIEMHYDIAPALRRFAARGAVGAVVILDHPLKAVAAQNAVPPHHQVALPLPALIAAEADADSLLSLAETKTEIRMVIEGTDESGTAANVIGRLDRGAERWVVVSTPVSGWFEATNERGPGIAMWLQLAQWAADSDLQANFLFLGLSGHELGNMGMDVLADSGLAPGPGAVALWLHLGSGIANQTPLLAAVSSSRSLSESVERNLIRKTALTYWPEEKMPKGSEQYLALERGYAVTGLFGADPAIHTRLDQSVGIDEHEFQRVFQALQELVRDQLSAGSEETP